MGHFEKIVLPAIKKHAKRDEVLAKSIAKVVLARLRGLEL